MFSLFTTIITINGNDIWFMKGYTYYNFKLNLHYKWKEFNYFLKKNFLNHELNHEIMSELSKNHKEQRKFKIKKLPTTKLINVWIIKFLSGTVIVRDSETLNLRSTIHNCIIIHGSERTRFFKVIFLFLS